MEPLLFDFLHRIGITESSFIIRLLSSINAFEAENVTFERMNIEFLLNRKRTLVFEFLFINSYLGNILNNC